MQARIHMAKQSIVRVFVDHHPAGSGFVVGRDGLIATCFHVVQKFQPTSNKQTLVTYSSEIQVEFPGGKMLPAMPDLSCQNQGFAEAASKDYCILKVDTSGLTPLAMGSFAEVPEGAEIYIGGFPLGIAQPVFAVGMISTKWRTDGYLNQSDQRDVAWLDITMNKGNSGGPVLLMTNDPKTDRVIGIATFGLNPFAGPAEELVNIVQAFPGNVVIMGVDFKKFGTLVGSALMTTSLGVNGCVAIDYLKSKVH